MQVYQAGRDDTKILITFFVFSRCAFHYNIAVVVNKYIDKQKSPQKEILLKLRKIILNTVPKINEEMKLAAVNALAELAREEVSEDIERVYGKDISFGPDYIIPKPFDPRVLKKVSLAVAKAAMDSGVAKVPIKDLVKYGNSLDKLSKELLTKFS